MSRAIRSRRWGVFCTFSSVRRRGGDTLFASMYAAYEALSDRMKSYLDGMMAVHDGEEAYRGTYKNLGVADKPVYPRAEHPVIRTHPVTGRKALYVNRGFTQRLLGVPRDESAAVLAVFVRARGEPAVSVPVPLAGELGGVLGQPVCAASGDVGLLAAHAFGVPGDGGGRQAGLNGLGYVGRGRASEGRPDHPPRNRSCADGRDTPGHDGGVTPARTPGHDGGGADPRACHDGRVGPARDPRTAGRSMADGLPPERRR